MVIRKPFKVLVCLLLIGTFFSIGHGLSYAQSASVPGVDADALSADIQLRPPTHTAPPQYRRSTRPTVKISRYTPYPPAPAVCGAYNRRSMSLLPPVLPPLWGLFSLPGFPFLPVSCNTVLPRPGCKQFQLSASLWYAEMQNSYVVWGADGAGGVGSEIDLHDDLHLDRHKYIPEYEARYQLRPSWGMRYSFIPIRLDQRSTVETGFTFGGQTFGAGTTIYTKWDRYIHKFELVYSWFNKRWATSSIYAGYYLYDDRLSIGDVTAGTTAPVRSKGFGLASAGLSFDKVISTVGCGGGTASLNCKWTLQFLEDYFGWDGQSMLRISVPLQCARWGYLEAGWRWMRLEKGRPTDTDKTGFHGLIVAAGMTF